MQEHDSRLAGVQQAVAELQRRQDTLRQTSLDKVTSISPCSFARYQLTHTEHAYNVTVLHDHGISLAEAMRSADKACTGTQKGKCTRRCEGSMRR